MEEKEAERRAVKIAFELFEKPFRELSKKAQENIYRKAQENLEEKLKKKGRGKLARLAGRAYLWGGWKTGPR